jgi:hypothetical protein
MPDHRHSPTRLFTLAEANHLLPSLAEHLSAIKRGNRVLLLTRDEIKKASQNAPFGGGSSLAAYYLTALEWINARLQKIQDLGVLVKDTELGLCDFPYLYQGRIVYLCWKLGEPEIGWWHETFSGFADRQPLTCDQF